MRLIASLIVQNRGDELLADVDVQSDTAEEWGFDIKRKVVATIRQTGSIWDEFMRVWVPMRSQPIQENGFQFIGVRGLQVDHDYYGFFSWINVEGRQIRLILMESFDGSVEEYQKNLVERNSKSSAISRQMGTGAHHTK